MSELKAARLNGKVVVTGGYGGKDEVLQYNHAEDTWTQKGKMERERYDHAIVEANLRAVCLGKRETEETTFTTTSGDTASSSTTTPGLNPMLALVISLLLFCSKRCDVDRLFKAGMDI